MRVKKWMILLFYVYLIFSFSYLFYTQWMNGAIIMSVIWGLSALAAGYQVIRFLKEKKKDGWNKSYVVLDQHLFSRIKLSLALSYIFVLIFLIIGAYGLYQGYISVHPIDVMVAAIIFSLLVFMVSQIFQWLISL